MTISDSDDEGQYGVILKLMLMLMSWFAIRLFTMAEVSPLPG
jgi:hypothetical protein